MWNTFKKKEINLDNFKDLVSIASADGQLDEKEKKFLLSKAEKLNLPKEEVEKILSTQTTYHVQNYENKKDKEQHLADIVFMAMIDGELKKDEYEMCVQIAQKMELTKNDVDRIIGLVKKMFTK